MKPVVVMPFHDPEGMFYPHLVTITPLLKQLFSEAHLGVSADTQRHYPAWLETLHQDSFFRLIRLEDGLSVGEQFHAHYSDAAQTYPADTILHLCYIDRLALALETEYRAQFVTDITALSAADLPLIFQRSEKAWASHPANYIAIEGYVTTIGKMILGKSLDFAWCHMALTAGQLKAVLPSVNGEGISMVAEMVLPLVDHIHTRDVDWLAWEDPFILKCDPAGLKQQRESSLAEIQKRLSYTLPMVERIVSFQRERT